MVSIVTIAIEITEECERARAKFGNQFFLSNLEWQSILLEEVGEAAMLVTKTSVRPITHPQIDPMALRAEIAQIAAVAIRWIAAIDFRYFITNRGGES